MNLYNPYLVPYGMCNVNPAAGIGIPKNVIDIEHDPYQEQFQIANKVWEIHLCNILLFSSIYKQFYEYDIMKTWSYDLTFKR